MSERKVLNKYYPPDFDPNKIPRLKRPRNRQFSIRIMAPFNMRCANCGEYIYKGKKFNSRQERVEDEDYLGLMIFRFYIKCPRCVSEISFKTDPQNCDYSLEAGATRNFEALRTAERLAEQELKEKEEEEKNNPMKVLENRTKASQQEMEMLETLEELRELNSRHAKLDHEEILRRHKAYEEQLRQLQDEEDEQFIRSVFGKSISGETIKRVHDDDKDDAVADADCTGPFHSSSKRATKPTDILTETSTGGGVQNHKSSSATSDKSGAAWQKSIGSFSKKSSLLGIVRKKNATEVKKIEAQEERASKSQDDCTGTTITRAAVTNILLTTNVDSESEANAVHKDNVPVHEDKNESCKLSQSNATNEGSVVSKPTGLGMLGAYSDTSTEESD